MSRERALPLGAMIPAATKTAETDDHQTTGARLTAVVLAVVAEEDSAEDHPEAGDLTVQDPQVIQVEARQVVTVLTGQGHRTETTTVTDKILTDQTAPGPPAPLVTQVAAGETRRTKIHPRQTLLPPRAKAKRRRKKQLHRKRAELLWLLPRSTL